MPHTWQRALDAYRYPVDLRKFVDAPNYPGWFQKELKIGDRRETMEFESYFRQCAPTAIEPWLEVVFWKQYSTGYAARNNHTRQVATYFSRQGISPQQLWDACAKYSDTPSLENFDSFRKLFGFEGKGIATVATFPAFCNGNDYPMVDSQIAEWVRNSSARFNAANSTGPQLEPPTIKKGALTTAHFRFVTAWTSWCRYTAQRLSHLTSSEWRARDVEMAAFTATRDKRGNHSLNPLQSLPSLIQ